MSNSPAVQKAIISWIVALILEEEDAVQDFDLENDNEGRVVTQNRVRHLVGMEAAKC